MSDSDALLWQRAVAGNSDAFGDLYGRHSKAIYNYLFRRTGDWSEAEDLVASVFLEAYRRRDTARVDDGMIVPWLFGIATNLANNRARLRWRGRRLLERVRSEASVASHDTGLARYEAQEQMRALLVRLRGLPREQQDVVALCLWSGLSYDEAAEALSVPVGTVRSRLSRARAALAEREPPSGRDFGSDARPDEVIP